jgi:phosphoglycerate dehydrogenase-like enzyme
MTVPRIALSPEGVRPWLADAATAGGAAIVAVADADALLWTDTARADELAGLLAAAPQIRWVQLPWAGIEPFVAVLDPDRVWTCAKGVYAEPVAEHALALMLAGLRHIAGFAGEDHWTAPQGHNLLGGNVTILGAGGITESLLRLLSPFEATVTVVRKRHSPMAGADRVVGLEDLDGALAGADAVVLALALTPETVGLIDAHRLLRMPRHAWLVNVARGRHVVTDDLVDALRREVIGGAGLDVTDPEPLPDGHPLWSLPNCVITPHTANTPAMAVPLLGARIRENVRRYAAGEPLLGLVDPALGY